MQFSISQISKFAHAVQTVADVLNKQYLAHVLLPSQLEMFDHVCRGVGARALSNGINSAVFFCFFEALRATFAKKKEQVGRTVMHCVLALFR